MSRPQRRARVRQASTPHASSHPLSPSLGCDRPRSGVACANLVRERIAPRRLAMSKHGTTTWSLRSAAAAEPQADGSGTRSVPSPATRATATTDASSFGSSSPPQTPTTNTASTSAASSWSKRPSTSSSAKPIPPTKGEFRRCCLSPTSTRAWAHAQSPLGHCRLRLSDPAKPLRQQQPRATIVQVPRRARSVRLADYEIQRGRERPAIRQTSALRSD